MMFMYDEMVVIAFIKTVWQGPPQVSVHEALVAPIAQSVLMDEGVMGATVVFGAANGIPERCSSGKKKNLRRRSYKDSMW